MSVKILSKKDTLDLLEYIYGTLGCKNEDELKAHVLKFRKLIPFEFSTCARANIKIAFTTPKATYDIKNISYPEIYLKRYLDRGYHRIDPMAIELATTQKIQYWSDVHKRHFNNHKNIVYQEAEDCGLKEGFTHGIPDFNKDHMVAYYFAGKQMNNTPRTRMIIRQVVPFLCEKWSRILDNKKPGIHYRLTARELEVLKWLKEGKGNYEISRILQISQRTVNYHANNIRQKLNAMNRTHAVVIALENKIIDF